MKSVLICGFVLCVLLSSAQSKSYYYRIGREIIVPTVDTEVVKEVIAAELKKDGGVGLVEESVPVVSATDDEGRADASPVANLEVMEILPVAGNPLKSATVAETVKNAAIAVVAENTEVKAEEPTKEAEAAEAAVVSAVKTETAEEPKPVIRQQNLLQQAQETLTNLVQNNPIANAINSIRNPTTSTPAIAPVADAIEEAASAVAAEGSTPRPQNALLQTIQNTLNNLGNAFQRPATPPAVAADSSGIKNGDEPVPIIQQTSNPNVNNKVDIAKSA